MEKFIVTPKEDKSVTMTIRIDRALQEEYNDLAAKTKPVYILHRYHKQCYL